MPLESTPELTNTVVGQQQLCHLALVAVQCLSQLNGPHTADPVV
jgi:hypothetical protein